MPSGAVTFEDGGTSLGSGMLTPTGVVMFATSTLSATSHSITAIYSGDANFNAATSAALLQMVNPSVAPTITTPLLVSGEVGLPYSATMMATGGTPPYDWTASGLPAGLITNAATGVISGTPMATGAMAIIYEVTVTVTDLNGQMASQSYALTINPKPMLTPSVTLANLLRPGNFLGGNLGLRLINSCNSTYNGVFFANAPLTVSAGQNCTIVNGGVSGNVQLNGGNLILTDSQVGANVTVNGGNLILTGSQVGGNVRINGFAAVALGPDSTNITFNIGSGSTDATGSLQIDGLLSS